MAKQNEDGSLKALVLDLTNKLQQLTARITKLEDLDVRLKKIEKLVGNLPTKPRA